MTDRRDSRIRAYRYILEQIGRLNQQSGGRLNNISAECDYISLDELTKLGDGIADPSVELVSALKKLFRSVAKEAEINKYLVIPFLSE